MSSDRSNKPLKPALASTRTQRTPLTPRVAGNATTSTSPAIPRATGVPRLPTSTRTPIVSPRAKPQEDGPLKDTTGSLNVTPRSAVRRSRVDSPSQEDIVGDIKPKSSSGDGLAGRSSAAGGMSLGLNNTSGMARITKSRSVMGEKIPKSPPLIRSPGFADFGQSPGKESIDSRFFHASDVLKQEPAPKRPEPKKTPSFFYADGKQDKPTASPRATSPVPSAVSEKRNSGPRLKVEPAGSKSPPMLSPSLAAATSPSFLQGPLRSPSPSKENIHLSYRKGASQIFGMRPTPPSTQSVTQTWLEGNPRPSFGSSHRKSPSLSSIDSGTSHQSRRRSATAVENAAAAGSPLTHEIKAATIPLIASPPFDLLSIDTSLASPAIIGSPSALSPTKHTSELAADARRERKVLDLEISNSSLLAINASLEREVRRQKAELKRFRRLSRAGRFSMTSNELPRRNSVSLDTLDEDDEIEGDAFDPDGDDVDDISSDDENSSLLSGGDSLSASAHSVMGQDRLAKDEKRLRVDLERHKELLVQSQSMNHSLKRCMYATEEMIREGKKALEYHVRVSDVKLGGRILTGHDDEEIEVDDSLTDPGDDGMESARGLLDVWSGVGRRMLDGSEASGDRDSGIEVDKPMVSILAPPRLSIVSSALEDTGRPSDGSIDDTSWLGGDTEAGSNPHQVAS